MTVGVVVLIEDGSVSGSPYLMLKQERPDREKHYAPPAGTLDEDIDDSPRDTAVREVKEETGLEVRPEELEKLFETGAQLDVDKLIWFRVEKKVDRDQIELNYESDDYEFLSREEALQKALLEDTRDAFERLE